MMVCGELLLPRDLGNQAEVWQAETGFWEAGGDLNVHLCKIICGSQDSYFLLQNEFLPVFRFDGNWWVLGVL